MLDRLEDGELDPRIATVMVAALRVLLAAGGLAAEDDDALAEVELRGRLMFGLPPRDEAEWDLARARFTPEALAEIERLAALFERDGFDGREPAGLGDQ